MFFPFSFWVDDSGADDDKPVQGTYRWIGPEVVVDE